MSESATLRFIASQLKKARAGCSAVDQPRIDSAIELVGELEKQAASGLHRNPASLVVLGNPGGSDWSSRVYAIAYKHKGDGKDYKHDFERGVSLRANKDGTVTIYRPDRRPVWEDF